jgi:hypothetical protein
MPHTASRQGDAKWDAFWAEYDARQPLLPLVPCTRLRPAKTVGRSVEPRCLLLFAIATLVISYVASPIAAAVFLTDAVQRLDVPALAERVDWAELRKDVYDDLVRDAERHGPMPPFIYAMAAAVAERIASPQGLVTILAERADGKGDRTLVWNVAPKGLARWRVTWRSNASGQSDASLTLAMTSGMRWKVVSLEWLSSISVR